MRNDLMINLSFRTQQFVLSAAQEGNFHKAARKLGVTASLVTRNIDKLESNLGVRIFDRSRSTFFVTDAGRLFLQEIREANDHITQAWDLARYQARIEQGPLRIGYSAYIHSRLIPILERFRSVDMKPDVEGCPSKVVIEAGCTVQLIDSVLRGRLDAAFGMQPVQDEDLWVKPIAREPFCVCLSKNHRFAHQASISIKQLDGEMLFFLPKTSHPGFYERTVEYIESTGAKPILREVISFTHAMEIVAYNFGVALLPHSVSRHSHMGVLFKPVTDKLLWIETALFARQDQRHGRLQNFLHSLLLHLKAQTLDQ